MFCMATTCPSTRTGRTKVESPDPTALSRDIGGAIIGKVVNGKMTGEIFLENTESNLSKPTCTPSYSSSKVRRLKCAST